MSTRKVNPVGSIPLAKHGAIIERKRLQLGNTQYIMTSHETDTSITYYIGSRTIYCVDINITKKMDNSTFVNRATLSKIRKDDACYAGTVYEEGITTANLFKFALQFLFDKHPSVKTLVFNDSSSIKCDNGFPMDLAIFKMLTDGKTWYQKTFGANFLSKEDENNIRREIERINELKQQTPFNIFSNNFPVKSINLPFDEVQAKYEETKTWQDFFKWIEQKIGKRKLCNVLSERYDLFVNHFLVMPKMDRYQFQTTVQNIGQPYSIEAMEGGGRKKRKTRRFRWVKD
jgi:hypothetical protein